MATVILAISTDNTAIPLGTPVVRVNSLVRAFDANTDSPSSILGVTSPKTNGVVNYTFSGSFFYEKTSGTDFDGYLRYIFDSNGDPVSNPNYDPSYDWQLDDTCQAITVHGLVSVLNTYTSNLPASWLVESVGSMTTVYFIV